ncbi:hypothetical protein Isolate57626_21400 [Mycobacteroides abscessus subsp. abscessus]
MQVTDALGLAVFCVTGTAIAAHSGLAEPSAALLGAMTAIGGGVIRDLLSGETPMLLRPDSELYAVPAMLGASITALLIHVGLYTDLTGLAAALAAFGLRMLAMRFHWHAPQARRRPRTGRHDDRDRRPSTRSVGGHRLARYRVFRKAAAPPIRSAKDSSSPPWSGRPRRVATG